VTVKSTSILFSTRFTTRASIRKSLASPEVRPVTRMSAPMSQAILMAVARLMDRGSGNPQAFVFRAALVAPRKRKAGGSGVRRSAMAVARPSPIQSAAGLRSDSRRDSPARLYVAHTKATHSEEETSGAAGCAKCGSARIHYNDRITDMRIAIDIRED
jgi:hypothetical protein